MDISGRRCARNTPAPQLARLTFATGCIRRAVVLKGSSLRPQRWRKSQPLCKSAPLTAQDTFRVSMLEDVTEFQSNGLRVVFAPHQNSPLVEMRFISDG